MANHICPWWVGYLLISPFRHLAQAPKKILGPHVRPGMTVLDIGCAMGFFSLDAAKLAGPQGRVICVDLQPKMIQVLKRRAAKAGLSGRIVPRLCSTASLEIEDLQGQVDLALAFNVVHEVPDRDRFLAQVKQTLKPDGRLLLAEPSFHVRRKDFGQTVSASQRAGFRLIEHLEIRRSRAVLMAVR